MGQMNVSPQMVMAMIENQEKVLGFKKKHVELADLLMELKFSSAKRKWEAALKSYEQDLILSTPLVTDWQAFDAKNQLAIAELEYKVALNEIDAIRHEIALIEMQIANQQQMLNMVQPVGRTS